MDDRYDAFCAANPVFYDVVYSTPTAGAPFAAAERPLPDGWQRRERDDWFVLCTDATVPPPAPLPAQGWKIHVAACLSNADRILDKVWDYCVPRRIGFKFLRSPATLLARLSKYAPRGYSGKLVTIYPHDSSACETILRELGELLDGEPSPYILSDLRWGNGPLYVRYGAFASQYCVSPQGELVPAIADADGRLVPDRRSPVFHVPPWIELPEFLAPHLAARNAVTLAHLPYTIERVLHFSNGGGIYLGRDTRTGGQVVLKEGRPHSGLDSRGDDAVRRVEREYDTLRRLAGAVGVPEVYDLFWLGEHRFLAMQYVPGVTLGRAISGRHPLRGTGTRPEDAARYTAWAMQSYRQVAATVSALHDRGYVHGDLHLSNIIVSDGTGDTPDQPAVMLVDYEVAAPVDQATRPGLGNQGFRPPDGAAGTDIDLYALACLRLALFLPMTSLLWLSRVKARQFATIITEHFPVPAEFLAAAVEVVAPSGAPAEPSPTVEADPAGWPQLRDALVRAIEASATPDRDDRLFPGDIQQFAVGGLGLAYGAAGVLYALSVTGAGRFPPWEEWLVRRAAQPASGTPLGLYDGLHGVAFTLDHLGYRQEALDTLDICLRDGWQTVGLSLHSGLAGIGLALLHLADATGEPELRVAGRKAAELVAERLGTTESVPETSGGAHPYAGLMRGSAGPALLLLRAFDDTGDSAFLDHAAVALRQDLRRCVIRPNGSLEVNEGWRTMPYLDAGSVGIGLVLDQYLARRDDEQLAESSCGAAAAARSTLYIQPGLFSGRAGILLYLAGRSTSPVRDAGVADQVRALTWHALPYRGGVAFPGTALLRLSMDLATGTAGVLLALGAALHTEPVGAPLLNLAPPGPQVPAPRTPAPAGAGVPTLSS